MDQHQAVQTILRRLFKMANRWPAADGNIQLQVQEAMFSVNLAPSTAAPPASLSTTAPPVLSSTTAPPASSSSMTPPASLSTTAPPAPSSSMAPPASLSTTAPRAPSSSMAPRAQSSSMAPPASLSTMTPPASSSTAAPPVPLSSMAPRAPSSTTAPRVPSSSMAPPASLSTTAPPAQSSSMAPPASLSTTAPPSPSSSMAPPIASSTTAPPSPLSSMASPASSSSMAPPASPSSMASPASSSTTAPHITSSTTAPPVSSSTTSPPAPSSSMASPAPNKRRQDGLKPDYTGTIMPSKRQRLSQPEQAFKKFQNGIQLIRHEASHYELLTCYLPLEIETASGDEQLTEQNARELMHMLIGNNSDVFKATYSQGSAQELQKTYMDILNQENIILNQVAIYLIRAVELAQIVGIQKSRDTRNLKTITIISNNLGPLDTEYARNKAYEVEKIGRRLIEICDHLKSWVPLLYPCIFRTPILHHLCKTRMKLALKIIGKYDFPFKHDKTQWEDIRSKSPVDFFLRTIKRS
ncbi:hypothetical protein BC940DRAFT_303858 [Gongronella butleri]|nr:hypothetical protein BC940DRAFT_303858 [Gongronella butleri]